MRPAQRLQLTTGVYDVKLRAREDGCVKPQRMRETENKSGFDNTRQMNFAAQAMRKHVAFRLRVEKNGTPLWFSALQPIHLTAQQTFKQRLRNFAADQKF